MARHLRDQGGAQDTRQRSPHAKTLERGCIMIAVHLSLELFDALKIIFCGGPDACVLIMG